MKRLLFLLGTVLAALGFLAAAAELAAQALDPDITMLPAAHDVWRTVSPTTYQLIRPLEGSAWMIALALPGWLTLGVPGLALMIVFRKREQNDFAEHEHSLFLFDELARQAREQGYDGTADDMRPDSFDDTTFAAEHYAHDSVIDDLLEPPPDAPTEDHPEHHPHGESIAQPGQDGPRTRDYLLDGKMQSPRP